MLIHRTAAQVLQPLQRVCRLAVSSGGWARPGHDRCWITWPRSAAICGGVDACAGAFLSCVFACPARRLFSCHACGQLLRLHQESMRHAMPSRCYAHTLCT